MSKRSMQSVSSEALCKVMNLPLDAVITGVIWNPMMNDVEVYYNASSGFELSESSMVINRKATHSRDVERKIVPLNA